MDDQPVHRGGLQEPRRQVVRTLRRTPPGWRRRRHRHVDLCQSRRAGPRRRPGAARRPRRRRPRGQGRGGPGGPVAATGRRRRRAPRRQSTSPATGCRSSPRTGAGAWSRRRGATTRACRSTWTRRRSPTPGTRPRTRPPVRPARRTARPVSCGCRRASTSPGRTTTP